MYLGKGGKDAALKFKLRESGAGEYTFEATHMPGYYLTVENSDGGFAKGMITLQQVLGTSLQDPRHRFQLYAAQQDLQLIVHQFLPIDPLGFCINCDSRVIHTERVELTRYQVAATNRPGYFDHLVQIDHLTEVPIVSRFALSEHGTVLRPHIDTLFTMSTPKVLSPIEGWHPGDAMMEAIVHRWDPLLPTEWN